MDAVYNLSFTFPHAGSSVAFQFNSSLVQPADSQSTLDEGWGIDNVMVQAIPEAPALLIVTVAMALAGAVSWGLRQLRRAAAASP
jgi:hypothetical protein